MHLQQHFQAEVVSLADEFAALLPCETGRDEQHRRRPAEHSLHELQLVDNEILIEDGECDTTQAGRADEIVAATEVMAVGEDTHSSCASLLISQWNLVGAAVFLDPALRRRLALELGDDAGLGGKQGLSQRRLIAAQRLHFQPLMGDDIE